MPKCPVCNSENAEENKFCRECGYSFRGGPQTGQLNPDTVLENRYIIVKTVGRGGMGAVYMALDQRLNNRSVAIKEMSTRSVGGDLQAAIGSFKKEASMLVHLEHPALPRILDFFSKGEDRWYLVMDFIEGYTLAEIVRNRGPIPEAEVLNWARQLCEILDYLHNQQPPIIFRDLKPANIMLTPKGRIKLIDFGIARHFRDGSSADTTAYGSQGFAPPEQYGENQTSPSSDIYALGATLHYLLTGIDPGKNPFVFERPGKMVKVSPQLDNAIMQALEFRADNRPKTMREMLALLLPHGSQSAAGAYPIDSDPRTNEMQTPVNSQNRNQTTTIPIESANNGVPYPQPAAASAPVWPAAGNYGAVGTPGVSPANKPKSMIVVVCLVALLLAGGVYAAFFRDKTNNTTDYNSDYSTAYNNNQSSYEDSSQSDTTNDPNFKTYEDENYGFEIQYPIDWTKRDISGIPAFCSPLENSDDDFSENINIVSEDLSDTPVTLDEYKEASISNLEDAGYTVEGSSSATLDGEPGFQIAYSKTDDNLKYLAVCAFQEETAVIITYTARPDSYATYLSTAQEMIDSFQF